MRARLILIAIFVLGAAPKGESVSPPPATGGTFFAIESRTQSEIYSHFLSGLLLERYGEFSQAMREYNRTLELDPSATLIYRLRATLHLKMGDPEKALTDAQSYVRSHPDDEDALMLLSNFHLLLGQRAAAQLALEKILEKNPNQVEALMTLATLIMNEDPQGSVKLFEKLIRLDPSTTESYYNLGLIYQKLGEMEKSKEMFEKVIQLDSDSLPSLFLLGQMSEKDGDNISAIRYYESALQKMPENFSLRLQLILLYAQKMEIAKIEKLLDEYKENPAAPMEANLWLGIVEENKKEWKKALGYYLRAQKQTNTVELNIRLASLYSQLGEGGKALKSLSALVQKFPDNPQFRYFMGLAYLDLKRPRKALGEFQRAIHLKKEFASAYFQMGVGLDSLKKWNEAEAMFRQTIQVDTANASAYNYLGYTYADKNQRLDEARKLIEKALALDPENPAYLDSIGWLEFREGNFKTAVNHLKSAVEKMADPVIFDHLGDCYQSLDDVAQAALAYSRSLELNPESKMVRKKLKKLNERMVPTSPARKMLKQFEYNLSRATNISGALQLSGRTGYLSLMPSGISRGLFYFRKDETLNKSSASLPTELRVDFSDLALLPPLTLRYQNDPQSRWSVFPPEAKNQFPQETETILEMVTSFLNGNYLNEFDHPATKIEYRFNSILLKKGERFLRFNKKTGLVKEYKFDESSKINLPYSIQVEKYQKIGELWLPQKIKLEWLSDKYLSNNRKKKRLGFFRQQLQIEFSHISLDKIENKIFEIGKEPAK